ncbi:MAG: inositol monophosphatase [Phycisphaerae bacterium]|nr:inositol monophosphatase [Phycisphaerae bacterium]
MITTAELNIMLEIATKTAQKAGKFAQNGRNQTRSSLKFGEEIVTQYDPQCQKIIIDDITATFPEHGIIAEEGEDGKLFKQNPDGNDIWWVIDPIDGTRNFAHGLPYFAVSVGCIADGMPVVGVIYDPCTNTIFTGHRDCEPMCNGKVFEKNEAILDSNSQIALSSKTYKNYPELTAKIQSDYVPVNLGSAALHYAYTAKGAYAASLAHAVKLWDIAAGAALVFNTDIVVKSPTGKDLFPFDCESYHGEKVPVIFASQNICDELLKMV